MYSRIKGKLIITVFSLALALTAFAQDAEIFIDPQKSDPTMKRIVIIGANQVSTDVTNYGTIGRGNDSDVASGGGGVWPRGTGHDHIHEMTGFIGARVKDKSGKYVYIISDGYRDPGGAGSEIDPVTNIQYAFQPLAGYLNDLQDDIANSLNPNSWPFSWPGKDATWDGKWNGYFGLNQFNADQEVVYVMDDAYNKEFQFYPFPEDSLRRGLGVQVETRLFQWAHPLAKDIIFIHYQVSNAGTHNYDISSDSIFFGGYGDIGVGGRGSRDDDAAFDASQDLVYGWDHDNIGVWQKFREIPPGYIGWKFLESPGIDDDGSDNDDDGLTDESRANTVAPGESMIFGPVGIYGEPKEHFAADEDGDWNVTLHDVGKDGSGPLDEGYPGPDEGEGNGIPDQGEPNFGRLDNDESDQVGLTSFTAPLFGSVLVTDENNMWSRIQPGYFTVPQQNVNQYWIFGSGPFNLAPRETERFSTCFVFGPDEISLFQTSRVAQRIYDSDYRFAKPPRQPNLKAIAGDGKVTLIWDDLAEFSRDPVYGQDFEGYRIYKSTEPNFLEPDDITDSRGNPVFKKPVAQFDLANGLNGPHPLQFGQEIDAPVGIHYYMGDDSGLQHYFIDTDVINGRTYYYAVTAYDKGYDVDFYDRGLSDTELLFPITPSESPASITLQGGEIKTMDPNTAVVTPNPFPLDLAPGSADVEGVLNHDEGVSTGSVSIEIISAELLKDADYKVSFTTVPGATVIEPVTSAFTLVNETLNDTIVNQQALPRNPANGVYNNEWSQEFLDEGFVLFFNNQYPYFDKFIPENSDTKSYWAEDAQTNMTFTLNPEVVEPVSFVVEFADTNTVLDSAFTNNAGTQNIKTNFTVYEYGTNERLQIYIKEKNENGRLDVEGEWFGLVYKRDPSRTIYNRSWICFLAGAADEAGNPLPGSEWITPQAGDKFFVINKIPFSEKDAFKFKTIQPAKIENLSEKSLKKIRVVPNPYVVSSIFEKQPSLSGRGERFIRFINLPSECEVRIYTVNGFLVRKLQHSGEENGTLRWDLLSKDGLEVAFGLYIYHVDAPGIGEHIGKFVIIN